MAGNNKNIVVEIVPDDLFPLSGSAVVQDDKNESSAFNTVNEAIADTSGAIVDGVVKAGANLLNTTTETVDEFTGGGYQALENALTEKLGDPGRLVPNEETGGLDYVTSEGEATSLTQSKGSFNSAVSGITQFIAAYALTKKVLPLKKDTPKREIASTTVHGTIAEQIGFSPEGPRLSDLIQEYPALENPITTYLSSNADDGTAEARFKMAAEGILVGFAGEAAIRGLTATVQKIKTVKNNKKVDEAVEQDITTAAEELVQDTTKKLDQDIIDLFAARTDLQDRYKEAAELPASPEKAKIKKEARQEFKDDSRAQPQVEVYETNLTKPFTSIEELDERSRQEVAEFLAGYDGNVNLAMQKFMDIHGGDMVAGFSSMTKLNRLRDFTHDELLRVISEFKIGNASVDEVRLAFATDLKAAGLLQSMTSTAGQALNYTKLFKGFSLGTLDYVIENYAHLLNVNPTAALKFKLNVLKYAPLIAKAGAKGVDIVNEIFINGILSGPITHSVNFMGNAAFTLQLPLEKIAAGLIRGNINEMRKGIDMYNATATQAYISLKMGLKSLVGRKAILDPMSLKNEIENQSAINMKGTSALAKGVNFTGELIRIPSSLLGASDEFFKQINFRSFVMAEALSQGRRLGLKGKKLTEYANEELAKAITDQLDSAVTGAKAINPMASQGLDYARRTTFTETLDEGSLGAGFQNIVSAVPVLRQVTPFVRTPINILSETLQRSPLAFVSRRWRNDVKMGGQKAAEAGIRFAVGSLLSVHFLGLAESGSITGAGPKDITLKNNLKDFTGWQPYSFFDPETGEYKSYNRLDPQMSLMGIMASIHELKLEGKLERADEILAAVSFVLADYLKEKTFLQGLDQALTVLDDPEGTVNTWSKRQLQALVPYSSLMKTLNNDDRLRAIQTHTESLVKNLPGYSNTIPPRRNIIGEAVPTPRQWGNQYLSFIGITHVKNDPIAKAVAELQFNMNKVPKRRGPILLTDPKYNPEYDGKKYSQQTAWDRWQQLSGQVKIKDPDLGWMNLREALEQTLIRQQELQKQLENNPEEIPGGLLSKNYKNKDMSYKGKQDAQIRYVINLFREAAWQKMVGTAVEGMEKITGVGMVNNILKVENAENPTLGMDWYINKKNGLKSKFVGQEKSMQQFVNKEE